MKNLINKIKGQSESVAFVQELKKKKTKLLIKSKPPIRTDHHIFLEIVHPEDKKTHIIFVPPSATKTEVYSWAK